MRFIHKLYILIERNDSKKILFSVIVLYNTSCTLGELLLRQLNIVEENTL